MEKEERKKEENFHSFFFLCAGNYDSTRILMEGGLMNSLHVLWPAKYPPTEY